MPDLLSSAPFSESDRPDRVCVGVVVGAHGIKGDVRVKSFTADPDDLVAYGALADELDQRRFKVTLVGRGKGVVLCRLAGVVDRNGAESLKGTRFYLDRAALPAPAEDEFYHADLIGLPVSFADGEAVGVVTGLYDFGAGDLLEIRRTSGALAMIPFTRAVVPVVDVPGRWVVVERVDGLFDEPETPKARVEKSVVEAVAEDEWPEEDWK